VHVADDRVLSAPFLIVVNASEAEDFHVQNSCHDTQSPCIDLKEGFLEDIAEEFPVFLSERANSQLVLEAGPDV